jgi:apolipoprotein N-acyltransferase
VLRVAAVQPAIPEPDRHDPARFHPHLRGLLELTDRALAGGAVDLVAWPESAYERPAGGGGDAFLGAIANHLGAPLVTGVWRAPDPGEAAWRNAALLADDAGTRWVAEKVHPVPLYERAPDGLLVAALARAGLGSGRFARGAPSAPAELRRTGGGAPAPIGVLVCIDASYPELARRLRAGGARLLVVVANEAGTGAWSAALHARAARLRAIEGRVPVVRVANTGPTLWLDAYGRSVAELPAGAASGAAALNLAGPVSPFVSLGDAALVAAFAATALVAALVALARSPLGAAEPAPETLLEERSPA